MCRSIRSAFAVSAFMGSLAVAVSACAWPASAAEIAILSPDNWDACVPAGKEVDCIYGDFLLRNDRIVLVVAYPRPERNANMTVREVGAAVIDLTERNRPNDQLSAFYPDGAQYAYRDTDYRLLIGGRPASAEQLSALKAGQMITGKSVALAFTSAAAGNRPRVVLTYTIDDSEPYVEIESRYENPGTALLKVKLEDAIRADKTFTFGNDASTHMFWAYDEWFQQAYGLLVDGHEIALSSERKNMLTLKRQGESTLTLAPGAQERVRRRLFPASSLLGARGLGASLAGIACRDVHLRITDPAGPVNEARVVLKQGDATYGIARTGADGQIEAPVPEGQYRVEVTALGRPARTAALDAASAPSLDIRLEPSGYVDAEIVDEQGGPIPCKVAFHGKGGTETPFFGPDSKAIGVHNLHYSHNGRFRQELDPGQYDVIISYGPEYDAVFQEITVRRGEATRLAATMRRTVDTRGWVSADFHSHSTPSGDNTTDQLGRVLNLLCEQVEFAPCTEHNRIDSYIPHLERLGVKHLMATCSGIELTGSPLPINHQNAFPLHWKPRTQDGGAPVTDLNPVVQIERLAMWDGGSDKLVQGNHPNLVQILGDRDLDGKPDNGFREMFKFMDVVEVHPPQGIFSPPAAGSTGREGRNPIFHWMQMLNLGYHITGVVNTDAHYTFHESGTLRNYLKSPTDDPAQIDTMEMVHVAEKGRVVMTNGPFLEVSLASDAGGTAALPGDDLRLPQKQATLSVRVQCPNWLDVNRVQVFLNGRPAPELNYTRRKSPERFGTGVVKFEARIPLKFEADTHVIVAAAGEGLEVGPVMGPNAGKQMPVAVANPIFVDVDGNGFKPNQDLLDYPLPLRLNGVGD